MVEAVDHPEHYGGDRPYEVIKVLDAWGLGFSLGNAVKYIARAGKKGDRLEDLRKARWYVQHEIELEERREAEQAGDGNRPAAGGGPDLASDRCHHGDLVAYRPQAYLGVPGEARSD